MASCNLDYLVGILLVGDVTSSAVLSASMRDLEPRAVDTGSAAGRFVLGLLVLACVPATSKARLLVALVLLLSSIGAFVEMENKTGEHAVVEFVLSLCFSLLEACLLVLNRSLLLREKKRASNSLNEPLLQETTTNNDEEDDGELSASLNEADPYKGQGSHVRRLLYLAYPERYILGLATLALFISASADIVTPGLFGSLIQTISVTKDEKELNKTTLLLCLLFVVSSTFAMIRGALYTLAGERLVARFRVRLFDSIIHQTIAFFDENQSGELQSRLSSDTSSIQNAVTVNVSMSLRWLVSAIVSLVVIFIISWKLSLTMLTVVPAVGIGATIYGRFVRDLSTRYQDALAKAADQAEEAFGNVRTVRSFAQESREVKKYRIRVRESYRQGRRRAWAYGFFLGGIGLLSYLSVALVLWVGGRMVIRETDNLTSAGLTSFLLYTLNLAVALGGLTDLYSTCEFVPAAQECSMN